MRRIIRLSLFALLVSDAIAQHRGGSGRGFGGSGFAPAGPRQGQLPGGGVVRGFGSNRGPFLSPYGFGYQDGFLPYDAGTAYGYTPQPNIIIVQQPPPPPVIVQQPPRDVLSVIHDYVQPAPSTSAPSEGEPLSFGIVLKDGSTRPALAVVVADDVLHYVDSEGRDLQISLDEVDREATRKLNRERKLTLWLPATPQ